MEQEKAMTDQTESARRRVYAANQAQGFFLSLIDVACLPGWRDEIPTLASDSGWSVKSLESRLKAIRWHMEQGIMPEAIAEMGAERTVSEWQIALNLGNHKAPGRSKYWKVLVSKETGELLEHMLVAVRTATGANRDEAMRFVAELVGNSDPLELQHQYKQVMGE